VEEVPVVPGLGLGWVQPLGSVVAHHWWLAELPLAVSLGVPWLLLWFQELGYVDWPWMAAG